MLHAVSYALLDSVNVLLIGVVFSIALMQQRCRPYAKIAGVLIAGDWFGVFLLSALTMFIFDGIGDLVRHVVESAAVGIILILVGLLSIIMTVRGGDSSAMIARLAAPLRQASPSTFGAGMVLGLIQSATSVPFFVGLAYLSAGDFSALIRYGGLFIYASLALSIPCICAVAIGIVLRFPDSPLGRGIAWVRERGSAAGTWAGYAIGVVLLILGAAHLIAH